MCSAPHFPCHTLVHGSLGLKGFWFLSSSKRKHELQLWWSVTHLNRLFFMKKVSDCSVSNVDMNLIPSVHGHLMDIFTVLWHVISHQPTDSWRQLMKTTDATSPSGRSASVSSSFLDETVHAHVIFRHCNEHYQNTAANTLVQLFQPVSLLYILQQSYNLNVRLKNPIHAHPKAFFCPCSHLFTLTQIRAKSPICLRLQ